MEYVERKLHYLDPATITSNLENPRGLTPNQITSDKQFKQLAASIKEHGILEPIIVSRNGNGKKYTLIDGERRWRAALQVKKSEIPALVATNEVNGRILAYQVHKLRKDWQKAAETKSIKKIIEELEEENPDLSETELKKKIMEITGSSRSAIDDIFKLIKYDENIIDKVLQKELNLSHLVQIDQSFIIRIKKNYPEILETYNEDEIRQKLVQKTLKGRLGNTRYLIDVFGDVFKDKKHHKEIAKLLKDFLRYKTRSIQDTYRKWEDLVKSRENIKKTKKKKRKKKQTKKKKRNITKVPKPTSHKRNFKSIETKIIEDKVFDLFFSRLREGIIEFQKRSETKIKDEKSLQDFVYAFLRCLFISVEYEDPTEKLCQASNRVDFVLKDHSIIIELKYVRNKRHAKKIQGELAEDCAKYKQSKYGNTVLNYVYDPNNHIENHEQFLKQLKELIPDAYHYVQ